MDGSRCIVVCIYRKAFYPHLDRSGDYKEKEKIYILFSQQLPLACTLNFNLDIIIIELSINTLL